ncbi:uncharacterized protein B0I36DRAFT_323307 [Microdochium trichocladiopsis]|uniref:Uncharacterized protein n=1 Tax=Microdochium trichocladiopsis TaxID=1682393 RepID=A0A9P9BQQ9_9PEZI|nr:uncharacterized protein B0I36DRAFT_323307 [Microdochium trichocladiopsis]KAH7031158.1 hypothetical protein B0I36DRAFT_323307 [Microdochium trichocladiopsis]
MLRVLFVHLGTTPLSVVASGETVMTTCGPRSLCRAERAGAPEPYDYARRLLRLQRDIVSTQRAACTIIQEV